MYAGMHVFPKALLPAYRDAIVDDTLGAELSGAMDAVRCAGDYEVGGEHYKRVPRGYDPEHGRADLLRYDGLYAISPTIEPALLTKPELVDACFEHCRNMAPIQQWLAKVSQRMSET